MSEGNYLNIFGNTEDVPSSSSLVSLRLLKDANPEAFDHLAKEETRFLASAMALVKRDPLLKLKMGSDTLTASVNLARELRRRAEKRSFDQRIDFAVDALIDKELAGYGNSFNKRNSRGAVFYDGKSLNINMKPTSNKVFNTEQDIKKSLSAFKELQQQNDSLITSQDY